MDIIIQHENNIKNKRAWAKDKKNTYKNYIKRSGTFGSMAELIAATKIYDFKVTLIKKNEENLYRIENINDFKYNITLFILFKGDFLSGHLKF